jgi:hypothetical protein
MDMFRDTTGSEMTPKNFGVGSTFSGEWDNRYLVVANSASTVALVNLKTMGLVGSPVEVEDINCLSSAEARALGNQTGLNWTFSDFELDARGLKYVCDNKEFWDKRPQVSRARG